MTRLPPDHIERKPRFKDRLRTTARQVDFRLGRNPLKLARIAGQSFRSSLNLVRLLASPSGLLRLALRRYPDVLYRKWIRSHQTVTSDLRRAMEADIQGWQCRPSISVIIPNSSYIIEPECIVQSIRSLGNQIFPHWQLFISDTIPGIMPLLRRAAAEDSRIQVSFCTENGYFTISPNSTLERADSDYFAFLEAGDILSEDALFWMAREVALHPEADLLFSDEDRIDSRGRRLEPYFKPAWNPALMLSQNAFGHLGVYRRAIVEQVGGLHPEFDGAQFHDLILRCAEKTTSDKIRHIPRILYHRRNHSGPYAEGQLTTCFALQRGKLVISDHLDRVTIRAKVSSGPRYYKIDYEVPQSPPFVSIVVPSTLSSIVTAKCLASILSKSSYKQFELLVLTGTSRAPTASSDSAFAKTLSQPNVRILQYDESPFNFSRVCNLGTRCSEGTFVCFLNDDVEVITEDWLERLVSRAMLDGVGAVGPMLYYPNDTIQHAGVVLGIGGVAAHAYAHKPRGHPGYFGRGCVEQDYSCVTAACMVVKREIFDAVGGFDESLPVAFNDVDFCLKIRSMGARILWTPSVEMYHHESVTLGPHDSHRRLRQYLRDFEIMRYRWGNVLDTDPCYNPNLGLIGPEMFSLAWPPRVPHPEQILGGGNSISRTSELKPSKL